MNTGSLFQIIAIDGPLSVSGGAKRSSVFEVDETEWKHIEVLQAFRVCREYARGKLLNALENRVDEARTVLLAKKAKDWSVKKYMFTDEFFDSTWVRANEAVEAVMGVECENGEVVNPTRGGAL